MRRTKVCLEQFPDELDICLQSIPEERLDSLALSETIDRVLGWASAQAWLGGDLRRMPMERADAAVRHPLAGYCLSILLHWTDLYYVLEPDGSASSRDLGTAFESLMAEFSGYVIAAQATIDPSAYITFCRQWWGARQLPDGSLYPVPHLASRVAGASRAMRRLSRVEHRALLQFLLDSANGQALHERVWLAMESPQFAPAPDADVALDAPLDKAASIEPSQAIEADWRMLQQIALLLEAVRPGWMRPGTVRKRHGGRRIAKRTHSQHRTFRDGYVRVPEQGVVRLDFATEDGFEVEHLQPLPAGEFDNVAYSQGEDDADEGIPDPDGPSATPATADSERPGDDRWIPVGEQQTDADLDVVAVSAEGGEGGEDQPATAQRAGEHIRRYYLALGIAKERLSPAQVQHLLAAIQVISQEVPSKVLLALHASVALGRSLHDIEGFEIHQGTADPRVDPERIHYFLESQQWLFNVPAAAWADLPQEPIERPRLRQLWLDDRTGFHVLIHQCRLFANASTATTLRPFQKLTQTGRADLAAVLKAALPRADPTLAKCASFLFYRLLEVTGGDLGVANLITSHEHSHSGSVKHYANYPANVVWDAYRDAWRDGAPLSPRPMSPTSTDRDGQERRYGAKRVPRLDAVRSVIALLAERVRNRDLPAMARHNSYTAYTLVGMVLGLGMRPVTDLFVTDVGGRSERQLLASLLDKAKSGYDRRVNPVPDALAQQLRHYTTYRNGLASVLPPGLETAHFIHLGPAEGEAEAFRPGQFAELVGQDFPLELYALRRFVRTELASRYRVAAEDLDAYMGHWLFGASPFDPLSTYPMQRLYRLANGPLTRLLGDMGFAPLAAP